MIGVSGALRQAARQQTALSYSVPAPVGGVNARDSLAAMPPTDSIICDNWFCQNSFVQVRNGCASFATGLPSYVETLMGFTGITANKLFGVSNGSIFDCTMPGAVGAAVVTGLTNSRLQHAMFNAGSGPVLLWVNGADTPQVYNGTAWANSTVNGAGLTASNLITVTVHQQRCWYIEKNTMNAWYTAPLAFQGAVTQLPLGQLFARGGFLMQMASWTIDNVAGINAYAAFITSEGEVAIYQGYDPSSPSTWSLVGVFKIGRPIGRRCISKYGSDVLCLTADGLTPLSKAMLVDRTMGAAETVTYKITNAINTDVTNYAGNFGWQIAVHPIGLKLIVNVPEVTDTTSHQWVKNTSRQDDGGWSRFRGWNAVCWEVQQDSLYFGGNGTVFLADSGTSDAGTPINVDCKPAFSYFDVPGQLKNFCFARPIFFSNVVFAPIVTLNVDFQDTQSAPIPLFSGSSGSLWDVSPWDITPWGDLTPGLPIKNWEGVNGFGYVASGRLTMQVTGIVCNWYSTDYLFEKAGPI